ncbi:DUF1847 domain-containing protein [Intestinimonas massiliensis (ex Afouda et al. 2020)]|uniref:DUF1847 domain-containing protein n=1 Tax=Intestinimonas massiliensis (ex Afouda et al. 2020) TaxID=1673721 RepID=UPI001032314D|nr:DUF1847 domain-containing protein [Intestinimonas massiliensis (ex Afouda et al. 2020)]
MEEFELSCADCGTKACRAASGPLPPFCTTNTLEPGELEEALALSNQPENQEVLRNAAQVEYEGYCKMTRVEEIMDFARRMGFHKLGIATCVGLLKESNALARILRANGFQVCSIACKAGRTDKSLVGIDEACKAVGVNMCNPILQARHLNRLGTELNIVVGLCVGHDSMFYKYAEGLTTTLVTKDRVTGHNPAAVLYNLDGYYKRLLDPPAPDEK